MKETSPRLAALKGNREGLPEQLALYSPEKVPST